MLAEYLARVDWEARFPIRLYPFVGGERTTRHPVAIDPATAYGPPIVARVSISTATIAERIDAPLPEYWADIGRVVATPGLSEGVRVRE